MSAQNMMNDKKVKIVHHHIFKCAGSTLMWILERNYPGGVLYVEGPRPGSRIACDQVAPCIANDRYRAVSSHVLAIPRPGGNIGDVHFSLLRDPLQRLLSAYRYQKKIGNIREDMALDEFIETNFQADNFQAKHSSMPDPSTGVAGWRVDGRIYEKIDSGEILFGLVEWFDQSMLLLEAAAAERGFTFDGAYPLKVNTTADTSDASSTFGDDLRALCARKNLHDYRLYDTVKDRFLSTFSARFGESDLQAFASRCEQLRQDKGAHRIRVPAENEWLRLTG